MQTLTDRETDRPAAPAVAGAAAAAAAASSPPTPVAAPDGRVLRGGAGVLLLRGLALGPALIVAVGLARLLGDAGFGAYQTALAWLAVLAVPAGLGVEKLVVQGMAAHRARGEWGLLRGLLRSALLGVLAASLLVGALGAAAAWSLPALAGFEGLWLVLLTLPLMATLRVVQAALQGFEHVVLAQLPELLLVPVLSLLGVLLLWLGQGTLSVADALGVLCAANAAALVFALVAARRRLPWSRLRAERPRYDLRGWTRAAAPLLGIAALLVVNARTDVLMLGALDGVEAVGPYGAALRCAGLIATVLVSANAALAPAIARHHSLGERAALQRVLTRTVRCVSALGALGAAVFLVFGEPLLAVFGPGFTRGYPSLAVLALAQLVNVAMCAPGLVLMMTGHMRLAALGLLGGAVLNVGLNALLIPPLGGVGAAVATAVSTLCWTVGLAVVVWRRLGLDTTILGRTA